MRVKTTTIKSVGSIHENLAALSASCYEYSGDYSTGIEMALNIVRSRNEEIPQDAVSLTEEQALIYKWKIITEWETKSDTKALLYTPAVLGVFSAATGIFVNKHYRQRLRLGNYGKLSTYLPIVVVPAMFSMLAHKMIVQRDVILKPLDKCPICLQIRGATLQTSIGVLYPTVLAPMAAFMFATRHYTYRLPSITQEPKEVFKLWQKFTRPLMPAMMLLMAGQGLITMYLTGRELEESLKVQIALQEMERSAEEQYQEEQAQKQWKNSTS